MYTTHLIISREIYIIKHKFAFHFPRGNEISFSLNCSIVYRAVFIITTFIIYLYRNYTFIAYIWTCKIASNPTTQTIQHPITVPMV
jgi:hypothetical protein